MGEAAFVAESSVGEDALGAGMGDQGPAADFWELSPIEGEGDEGGYDSARQMFEQKQVIWTALGNQSPL